MFGLVSDGEVAHDANGKCHRLVLAPLHNGRLCRAIIAGDTGRSCLHELAPGIRHSRVSTPGSRQMAPRDASANAGNVDRTHLRAGMESRGYESKGTAGSDGHRFGQQSCFGRQNGRGTRFDRRATSVARQQEQESRRHRSSSLTTECGHQAESLGSGQTTITTQTSPRKHCWTGRPRRSLGNGAPSGEGAGRVNWRRAASATRQRQEGGGS